MRATPPPRLLLVVGLTLLGLPAEAKWPLEKVTVSGPGLTEPVEITDPEFLTLSNPWVGKFADWSSASEGGPDAQLVYEVTLHSRLGRSDLRPVYRFRYAPEPIGRPGHVYLPGKEEPWYRDNVRTILRDGHDGRWHRAAPEWETRIRRAMGRE